MQSIRRCIAVPALIISCWLAAGCDRWTSLANITNETIIDDWPEQYLAAMVAANKGDCHKSWDILWPLAKRHNRNATYLLSEMLLEGMQITINSNYKKDAFLFYLHSLGSTREYSIYKSKSNMQYQHSEFIAKFEKHDLGELGQVYQCTKTKPEADCFREYQERGIVPSFKKFIYDIEKQTKPSRTISGCRQFLGYKI